MLIFDLDGTLTDSGIGIMRCAQYALDYYGIHITDMQQLRPFVGPPLEDSFMMFYGFSHEQALQAVEKYRERYLSIGIYEQSPYEGAAECLQELKRRGHTLVIGTSKTQILAERVLHNLNLMQYFDFVAGRYDKHIHTKADVLQTLFDRHLLHRPDDAYMIGDRKYDILGAQAHHIPSIGVTWGYGDQEELQAAGATHVVSTFQQLMDVVQ